MFSRLLGWWSSTPATPAAAPYLAASSSSSSSVLAAIAESALNVGTSHSLAANGNDELGVFQKSIIAELEKLRANLVVWRKRKIELLGEEEKIAQPPVLVVTASFGSLVELMKLVKDDLTALITTPSSEIKAQLNRVRPYLDEQQQCINALVEKLHNTADDQEQKRIKVQMCDININMLEAFIQIILDIQNKIENSLTLDVFGEKLALGFLSTAMVLLAQFAFPQVDAEVEQGLRDYMVRSIRPEGSELDGVMTRLEGELAQAWKHVASDQVHGPSAADAAATHVDTELPSIVTPDGNASTSGLFAVSAADAHAKLRKSTDAVPAPAPALN